MRMRQGSRRRYVLAGQLKEIARSPLATPSEEISIEFAYERETTTASELLHEKYLEPAIRERSEKITDRIQHLNRK